MNITQKFNGIAIEIELNVGVNLLSENSGTGKTLLMQPIEYYCLQNEIKYTFLNYRNRENTTEELVTLCKFALKMDE